MNKTQAAIKYEHYETAPWAARAVLDKEALIGDVLDPCTGSGILAEAAKKKTNHGVYTTDIHDWGYRLSRPPIDFLQFHPHHEDDFTVFMNPPFSLACEFVEHALLLGAAKVICFQRLAWFESRERAAFFSFYEPDRIWLCGDRATSWRHDISAKHRKVHPKTGKKRTGSTTAHAWFIFEAGSKPGHGTVIDRIWKHKGEK